VIEAEVNFARKAPITYITTVTPLGAIDKKQNKDKIITGCLAE
jgi:hypothetical protein